MSDTAIRAENLGKRYQLGASKSGSFRESLTRVLRRPDTEDRNLEALNLDSGPGGEPLQTPDSAFWAFTRHQLRN